MEQSTYLILIFIFSLTDKVKVSEQEVALLREAHNNHQVSPPEHLVCNIPGHAKLIDIGHQSTESAQVLSQLHRNISMESIERQ
jgi:hypothetical protein